MNSHAVVLTLRLVHVVSGVLWVGGAAALAGFVLPAARETDGGLRYLRQLIWSRNLPRYLNAVLGLALLSGTAMYVHLLVLTRGAWAQSRPGIALGAGGLAAIAAAAVATYVAAPAIHRALTLAGSLPADAAGEDRAAIERSLRRYGSAMWLVVALLIGTAALMAVARYL